MSEKKQGPIIAACFENLVKKNKITEILLNPYPANMENIVISYQCWQMADGI